MATNPRYTCPFCKVSILQRSLFTHLHKNHPTDFWTETNKKNVISWSKKGSAQPVPLVLKGIDLYFSPISMRLYVKKAQAEKDISKAMNLEDFRAKLLSVQGTREVIADTKEVTALRAEMEQLRTALAAAQKKEEKQGKKVEMLETLMEKDAQTLERAEETKAALTTVLECLDQQNISLYDKVMEVLKEKYPVVYEEQKKVMDGEQGED